MLTGELSRHVSAGLEAWYGPRVALSGAPSVRARRWSVFVRFGLTSNAANARAVLVKIRRHPHLHIREAIVDPGLQQESRDDFQALGRLEQVIRSSPDFCAVRPLDYVESLSALVMEELPVDQIKTRLVDPRVVVSRAWQRRVEEMLERSGNLLRLFHEQMSTPESGPVLSDEVRANIADDLAFVAHRAPQVDLRPLRDVLDRFERAYGDARTTYSRLHRDYNSCNVVVTDDDRVGLLDPRLTPGAVYRDLAKLLIELETFSVQGFTHGRYLGGSIAPFQRAVLRGYFADQEPDPVALEFFTLAAALEKWRYDEERLTQRRLRLVASRGVVWRRGFLIRLVDRYREQVAAALSHA